MTGLRLGCGMLLTEQLGLERIERVEDWLQPLQFLLLQRDLEVTPTLVVNQVAAECERMYLERLLEHGSGKDRQIDAAGELQAAEPAYCLAIDAQRVAFAR